MCGWMAYCNYDMLALLACVLCVAALAAAAGVGWGVLSSRDTPCLLGCFVPIYLGGWFGWAVTKSLC
jgi:hypothetical protein